VAVAPLANIALPSRKFSEHAIYEKHY